MFVGAATEITGTSHEADGKPCQDRAGWWANSDSSVGIIVLCDGAGSCEHSEIGAGLICEWFPKWVKTREDWWILGKEEIQKIVVLAILRQLEAEAAARKLPVRSLASTFLAVTCRFEGNNIAYRILHLGDGVAACIGGDGCIVLSEPDNGEFAHETVFTTSESSQSSLRVVEGSVPRGSGFILMSDGSAESLFLKAKRSLAPAVADIIRSLQEYEPMRVSELLEEEGKRFLTTKCDDDCSLAILLDRDQDHPFNVTLEHPQPERIMTTRKKLIEVALPLEAINKASAREKSIRHGHPSTLHLWWARRPLAAARAVIFSQMVDDPSEYVDTLKSDPKLKRQAQAILKARHKLWQEATTLKEKAEAAGINAPAPGPEPEMDDILAEIERNRLFKIIEELVIWENTTNEEVLKKAREEIWQSWRRTCAENADHPRAKELFDRHKLPAFHDPFAGGGALPLEAQRLGLESYASDLNPVAVLINKAMIEIPPKFAGRPPVNPDWMKKTKEERAAMPWKGAQGLAEDVRYYGKWMRDEAEKRIGHLYPKIEITAEIAKERPDLKPLVGQELTVIAWLWARTVKSPNPAFRNVYVPLAATFMLSTKPGKEVWVQPVIEDGGYRFTVKVGKPKHFEEVKAGTKLSRGAFKCLMSSSPFQYSYIDDEANAGRMGARLMAIVAESEQGRIYLSPTAEQEAAGKDAKPEWRPDATCRGTWASNAQGRRYGFATFGDYFTARQLVALSTLGGSVADVIQKTYRDALAADLPDDKKRLSEGGSNASAYADAIGVYLSFALSKIANIGSSMASWMSDRGAFRETFARQGIAMTWDYAEANPFADAGGSLGTALEKGAKVLQAFPLETKGYATQSDAASQNLTCSKVVSTDPPYYDNVGYADLSDFFYVWLRHALQPVFPDLFATLVVPKAEELVAEQYRHGGKEKAGVFFLGGMTRAMHQLAEQAHPAFPVTIYYAFKQTESEDDSGTSNTGWETFLDAVIRAGFSTAGTWPMRTEGAGRIVANDTNALASSIVLVCRPRAADAPTATRREFVAELQRELPDALRHLQAGNIAPVDLAQAAIGPGMAVFTRYAQVLDAQGKALTVREALALINETLDTALAEQEGDFDPDSRWALAWFDQFGFDEGEFGVAEVLATAKATAISGLQKAGILESARGKVRLLRPEELSADWNPATDSRLTHWETVHHMIRVLTSGESAAAELVSKLGVKAEPARELAYRLYTLCERKKRAAEALAYNGLVQAWPDLLRIAEENPPPQDPVQGELL